LQKDLDNIHIWSSNNNLKLNASKSVHLRFTHKKEINIEYVINSEPIPRKSSHKHLRIIINDKLSFSEQSNSIVKTCLRNGNILKHYAVMQMQIFFLNYINLICYLYYNTQIYVGFLTTHK
jgi:hypothetical protein